MEYSLAAQFPLCLAVVIIIIDSSILQTEAASVISRYPPSRRLQARILPGSYNYLKTYLLLLGRLVIISPAYKLS